MIAEGLLPEFHYLLDANPEQPEQEGRIFCLHATGTTPTGERPSSGSCATLLGVLLSMSGRPPHYHPIPLENAMLTVTRYVVRENCRYRPQGLGIQDAEYISLLSIFESIEAARSLIDACHHRIHLGNDEAELLRPVDSLPHN